MVGFTVAAHTVTERLLAIDTSNGACSCALWLDGDCRQRYEVAPRGHGLLLLPMVESLLEEAGIALAELDALVLGRGPGSFTGLRIATGMVQGLAFAVDRPVVPVSSLAALAQGSYGADGEAASRVLTAFDARMGEVYWGAYQRDVDGRVTLLGDEAVCAPERVELPADSDWVGVGEGWQVHHDVLSAAVVVGGGRVTVMQQPLYPEARHLVELGVVAWRNGVAVPAEQAAPVYLRNKVV